MRKERYYDERDFEDGASPDDCYYDDDLDDDLPDGAAPLISVACITDLFERPGTAEGLPVARMDLVRMQRR